MSWPTKKLGEISEVNPRNSVAELDVSGDVDFLAMADVSENAAVVGFQRRKYAEVEKGGFSNFREGDVLVAKITPCFENGKGAFIEKLESSIGFGSTEFHVLRADLGQLLNKYLYYFVSNNSFRVKNAKFMTGSAGQRRISTDFLKRVKIPLPPLEIQKQIVERMDKIAEAQKLNDELVQKADELFQSLLHQELDPAGKNWETLMLEGVTKDVSDGNYSSKYPRQSEFVKSGIPFVRANNFKDGVIVWDDMRFISTQKHKELAKGHLKVGDVLIVTRGETGNVAFVSEEFNDANINAQIVRINSENPVTNRFVFYSLQTDSLKKQIRTLTTGTTLKQLPVTNLRKIKINLPSIRIQKQIVAKLSAAHEYKKQLLEQKFKLKELFDSVLHRLMSGELIH